MCNCRAFKKRDLFTPPLSPLLALLTLSGVKIGSDSDIISTIAKPKEKVCQLSLSLSFYAIDIVCEGEAGEEEEEEEEKLRVRRGANYKRTSVTNNHHREKYAKISSKLCHIL